MISKISFFFLMISCVYSQAQDLRGVWHNISLDGNSIYDSIVIKEKNSKGFYVGESADGDSGGGYCHFVHMAEYNPDIKYYYGRDFEVIDKSESHVGSTYSLYYSETDSADYLTGKIRVYSSYGDGYSSQHNAKYIRRKEVNKPSEEEIALIKQYKESRRNVSKGAINVKDRNISFKVYDYGQEDGDSISIFYNNEIIAYNKPIQKDPISFELTLDKDTQNQYLYFVANNLGKNPPNTAVLSIEIDGKTYEFKLFTNLSENNTITLRPIWTKEEED